MVESPNGEQPSGTPNGNHNPYYQNNVNGNNGQAPFRVPLEDTFGKQAKTYGIVGLVVGFFCCQLAGLILGIIAVVKANQSVSTLGIKTDDASLGKILGIIAIVVDILTLLASFFTVIIVAILVQRGMIER